MPVVIFTKSYPYDFAPEYIFVGPETRYLTEKFDKIVLVPRACRGQRLWVPYGTEVDVSYADFLQRNSRIDRMIRVAIQSCSFFHEIRNHPSIILYPSKILRLVLFSTRAELTRRWIGDLIRNQKIDPMKCILYSYWFDHTATGLGMIKREYPAVKVVSRAHGYDIYEQHYYPYYWPQRRETLDALDALFLASEAGRRHLIERYPEYFSKYETAHLGIKDPKQVAHPSQDGIFRIVSCSYIVTVKRLNLLVDGIAAAARQRPALKFEWTHFGDGNRRRSLERRMTRIFPENVTSNLLGNVPNAAVLQHYGEHPCDVFVNVSETEGGAPVSIQEAISYGIPVVATDVGGNPEIVSKKNGILLSPNPSPEEIASALLRIWDDPHSSSEMRKESRRIWRERFNAEVNFPSFAERLRSIVKD